MLTLRATLLRLGSNRILVILIAALVGVTLAFRVAQLAQDNQYSLRALAIANATAAMPDVITLLTIGDPTHELPAIAESIRKKLTQLISSSQIKTVSATPIQMLR
jgi:sensor histidine kinase regulating citrate/malate metabolism